MTRSITVLLLSLIAWQPSNAGNQDVLPAISQLLFDEEPQGPIELHPDAGTQVAYPLSTSSGALPFGHYLYLPSDFTLDQRRKFPLILFLHGLGEIGDGVTNLAKVLRNGPPKMINRGLSFPAVVVSPQLTRGNWMVQNGSVDTPAALHSLLGYFQDNYNIDQNRIYVTGLSLGGGGAWNYARLYSDEVAAVVPICGIGTNGQMIDGLASIGVWAFHSINDTIVTSRNSIVQMNRIAGTRVDGPGGVMANYPDDGEDNVVSLVDGVWQWRSGRYDAQGNTRFTVFPDNRHDSWGRAYNQNGDLDTPMWNWLFAQSR